MSTVVTPAMREPSLRSPDRGRPSTVGYWLGAGIVIVGLVAAAVYGMVSYVEELGALERDPMPADLTVDVSQPSTHVVYFEGNRTVTLDDLDIVVTDPTGAPVDIGLYEAELLYGAPDLTSGRALATFEAEDTGGYRLQASGVDGGEIAVGRSFVRMVLPEVAVALAIAGFALATGLTIGLVTLYRRSRSVR